MIKYLTISLKFVIFASILLLFSCSKGFHVTSKEGKRLTINDKIKNDEAIEIFVTPYRNHINRDLDSILAVAPVTFDKTKGRYQSNIGNMMADICLDAANKILSNRGEILADVCLLNYGGIRNIIPAGSVTARTAYEVMPFENQLSVLNLNGELLMQLVNYFEKDLKNHPFAGMQLYFNEKGVLLDARIKGEPIVANKIYRVVTSDYLANGGDNMSFFEKNVGRQDLDYKIRNVLIDYFKSVDVLEHGIDNRVIFKN
jgi:2',3'-cyclic-nucleotide 2'-phosphodiesterase (5'-nucleotidase family)